jgi:hypothetical protein
MNAGNIYGAMVPIQSYTSDGTTLGASFLNIPQTYQDLFVAVNGRGAVAQTTVLIQANINNTFGTNGSATELRGDGSSPTSTRTTNSGGVPLGYLPAANATSSVFGSMTIHILNYANSTTNKTTLCRYASDYNGAGITGLIVGLQRPTTAIISLEVSTYGVGNLVSGSTITLYGIRAVAS